MKNDRYVGILLVVVIVAAVSLAGCTNSGTPGVTATPAAGTPSGTVSPTTSPGGTLSTLGSAIDFNKVHWYEYQMNIPGMNSTSKMKVENGVTYNGVKANKMTMNSESPMGGLNMGSYIEVYSDPATSKTLGGVMRILNNGQVISETQIEPSSSAPSNTGSDPLAVNSDVKLTKVGIDPVTVPAGVYPAATKYTFSDKDGGSGSVWVDSSVPVPLKYEGGSGELRMSMVLTGWG